MAFQLDTNIPLMAQPARSFDPMAAFAGALQLRGQIEANRALAEQRQALADQRRMLIETKQREEMQAEALRGLKEWTPDTVYPIVGPKAGAEILKGIEALKTEQIKSDKELRAWVGTTVSGIMNLPESMRQEGYNHVRNRAVSFGFNAAELPEQFDQQFAQGALDWALSGNERVQAAAGKETRAETARHNQAAEAEAARAHDLTAAAQKESAAIARGNLAVNQGQLAVSRQRLASESAAADSPMTPEGLQVAAMQYIQTGAMPPLGMGKQAAAARMRIINEAGKIAKAGGGDPVLNAALYKADSGALKQQTQTLSAITAFENTAKKNLEVMEREARKIVDFGGPWINKPLRAAATGLGSTRMAAFNTARQAVVPEIARILTNPNLTGVLSDSARQEVDKLLQDDASLPQMLEAIRILRTDMDTRRKSLSDEVKAIQDRIGSRGGRGQQPAGGNAADPLGILR
jgi:hypothetical protein